MNSICSFSQRFIGSKTSEKTALDVCKKVAKMAFSAFVIGAVSIAIVHYCAPHSRFLYGYASAALIVTFSCVVFYALKSYCQWKRDQIEKNNTIKTIFGHKGFEKVIPDWKLQKSEQNVELSNERKITTRALIHSENHINKLLNELLKSIFSCLDLNDLCNAQRTCKRFHLILKDENLWKALIELNFGSCEVQRDFKKEYRVLISLRKGLFDTFKKEGKFVFFNNALVIRNNNSLKDCNGKIIIKDLGVVRNFFITKSFIYIRNKRSLKFLNTAYEHAFSINFSTFSKIFETSSRLIMICRNSIHSLDKTTGKELEKLEMSYEIEKSTLINENLFFRTKIGFEVIDLKLKLVSKMKQELPNNLCFEEAICIEKKIYVICTSTEKGFEKTLFIYDLNDLDKPLQILNLKSIPHLGFMSKVYGCYIYDCDIDGQLMRHNILTGQATLYKTPFDSYFSFFIEKNFIFASSDSTLQLFDLQKNNWYELEKYSSPVCNTSLKFIGGKLFLNQWDHNKFVDEIRVLDFGKFVSFPNV